MAKKTANVQAPRKTSKRERRMKIIIYIMILAMVLSTLTMGLSMLYKINKPASGSRWLF